MKKSLKTAEEALTKECNQVKDLEQELMDLKRCLPTTANALMLLPTIVATAGRTIHATYMGG